MDDLSKMHAATPRERQEHTGELLQICSPLQDNLPAWRASLAAHPDGEFSSFILQGIEQGFRIGFERHHTLRPARRNMPSAIAHPDVIDRYVTDVVAGGCIIGPFPAGRLPGAQSSRLGVVPKGHTPGKWRLITDLSFPEDNSVNDGIDPCICSLRYITVDEVARVAQALGPGALMAKIDIRAAYHLVPVHPDDRLLLGFQWRDALYIDGMLPFGRRSAPKIFTA